MSRHTCTCAVTSAGKSVNVFSTVDVFTWLAKAAFLHRHLDLTVSRQALDTPYSVSYEENDQRLLEYEKRSVKALFPWHMMCEGEVLLYLAYPFIEYQHQLGGSVTVHAACVQMPDGKGILILGKEGAGKTSMAIALCRAGAKLIGNDLVLIGLDRGHVHAKAGTKFFFLRYESARRNLPDLLRFFPQRVEEPWLCKAEIFPEALDIGVAQGTIDIAQVYLVHVDNQQAGVFSKNADTLVTRLYLNENLSRYIRSTCTTLLIGEALEFGGYIPSMDDPACYRNRIALMNALLKDLGIRYLSGSLPVVSRYIIANSGEPHSP